MFSINFYFIFRFVLFAVVTVFVMYFLLVKDACDYDFDISEALGFRWSDKNGECVSKRNYIYFFSPKSEFELSVYGYESDFEGRIKRIKKYGWTKQPWSDSYPKDCWEYGVRHTEISTVSIAWYCSGDTEVSIFYSDE